MKKSLFIFGMLLSGATLFTSCNKDLKDDVKDLKGRVNQVESIFGTTSEAITATTTFKDNNNNDQTITGTYRFKSSYSTQRLVDNGDGTYDITIERFSDLNWDNGAWMEFTYNPTTKAITDKRGGHWWSNSDEYRDRARYEGSEDRAGLTINITVDKLDVNTGDISVKFNAIGTEVYTNSIHYYDSPNQGKPMSTSFSFTGKLVK